jgi:hypothetical protein
MMKKNLRKDLTHIHNTISPKNDGSMHSKNFLDDLESKGHI